jgi:hypothetical protein
MSEPTVARPRSTNDAHWYRPDGEPCYEVPRAKGGGMRNTTLADARKLNLFPSVTTILKVLHKEALVSWMIEQACLAVLTAPKQENEGLDAFIVRVLRTEQQQHQERDLARDKGIAVHESLELLFTGQPVAADMEEWVRKPFDALMAYGKPMGSELILVGTGFAGRTDQVMDCGDHIRLWDYKATGRLPTAGAWPEHRLQLAAYARALADKLAKAGDSRPIIPGNMYVSTKNPGEYAIWEHENWEQTFEKGFKPLLVHWQWANQYFPAGDLTVDIPAPPVNAPTVLTTAGAPAQAAPVTVEIKREGERPRKAVITVGVRPG